MFWMKEVESNPSNPLSLEVHNDITDEGLSINV